MLTFSLVIYEGEQMLKLLIPFFCKCKGAECLLFLIWVVYGLFCIYSIDNSDSPSLVASYNRVVHCSLDLYWSFVEKTSVMQDPNPKWDHIFRWSVQIQIYPPHLKLLMTGDKVFTDLCLQWEPIQNGHRIRSSFQMKWKTRSSCQMKCTLRLDIPPSSDILWQRAELGHFQMKCTTRSTCEMKCTLR